MTSTPRIDPPSAGTELRRENPLQHVRLSYVSFIQGLFASRPHGNMRWMDDEKDTEIVITDESPVKPEKHHHRPTITLTRAPVSFSQLGFDDMVGFDSGTNRKTKSLLIPGTMVINCCSRVPLESENMAMFTARHVWLLRDLLMRHGGFYDVGRGLQVGSPSPAGSIIMSDRNDEWFMTSITSPYFLYETGAVTPLNQTILREVQVRMTAGLQTLPPQQPPIAGGHEPSAQAHATLPGYLPQRVPHPLNPTQTVSVRVIRGLKPARTPQGTLVQTVSQSKGTVTSSTGPLTIKV